MDSLALRKSFLDHFAKQGHEIVRSSPLVPANDPTLLFTNAGMVQFKDVFTGAEQRPYKRATTSQKCVRAGGKHNDLENVGRTARHHTFFEMLGNFSFGDYFKETAIELAWSWLTGTLKIDPQRLVITVFKGDEKLGLGPDDEARAIWKRVTGFGDERIIGMGMKDNFWMMGDTGPQGPCSEIHYFVGGEADLSKFDQEPGPDGVGWMEIWNLVFMQFERKSKDAPLTPLPRPSIDTGAGLERVAAVIQGVRSNYDTDLLRPLVEAAGELAKKTYTADDSDDAVSMRVLADHARATSFLLADNVGPSNEGRGYVLRRIMRRAIRHGVRLGLKEGDFGKLCKHVIDKMGGVYPELVEAQTLIVRSVDAEDQGFRRTLDRGLKLLDEAFGKLAPKSAVPGEVVFKLYDTYGFPTDLTRVIAEERGFTVDEAGFEKAMNEQRNRGDFAGSGEAAVDGLWKALRGQLGATEFVGYDTLEASSPIVTLVQGGKVTERVHAGEKFDLVVKTSPFYGESGGQLGDSGHVYLGEIHAADITDTQKPGGDLVVHHAVAKVALEVGMSVTLRVDQHHRDRTRANHSATHLLHHALRQVLGNHVAQKGSLVGPDRLRFDFAHFQPMTDDEKRKVEDLVNDEIRKNVDTRTELMAFDDAKKSGAVALFGEKYGDHVRVLKIGSDSVELCGGTHVRRAGDIGLFVITQELGIAQGVRRIEAQTGHGALAFVRKLQHELDGAASKLKAAPFEVAAKVESLLEGSKALRKELEDSRRKLAMGGGGGGDLMSKVREVGGIKVLASRTDADPKALREVADQLRDKLGSGVIVLGGVADGKVSLVVAVTADLTGKLQAGKIVAELAKVVGGKGGGRPDFAQAGGPDADKLDAALEKVFELVG
jgi:alanyl-tRNA synthetase